jgi:short-subunit dehydrogenase
VWITGATSGIGEALAEQCRWPDTKVFSVSRRRHPELETVPFQLTDPKSWNAVHRHVAEVLAEFRGKRALFIHNAALPVTHIFAGEGDEDYPVSEIMGNVASPLALGDLVLRAAAPAVQAGVDVGLVQISSASSRLAYPGMAIYSAGKAAIEQWVRVVRAEHALRSPSPWVVAVRPGFVDTPSIRRTAELPPDLNPAIPAIAEAVRTGENMLSAVECAQNIWGALADGAPEKAVLLVGDAVGA